MFLLFILRGYAQNAPINFHHIGVNDGLNDDVVNAVCQDKFGYIWFATSGALNRYNGHQIKRFTHKNGDSTSVSANAAYSMAMDNHNQMWFGHTNGLWKMDYKNFTFHEIPELKKKSINQIVLDKDRFLLVAQRRLLCYNIEKKVLEDLVSPTDTAAYRLLHQTYVTWIINHADTIFLSATNGIIIYDKQRKTVRLLPIPVIDGIIYRFLLDKQGYFWVSNIDSYHLLRVSSDGQHVEFLDKLLAIQSKLLTSAIGFYEDHKGTVWIETNNKGLIEYDPLSKKPIYHQSDVFQPNSIKSNMLYGFYISTDGMMWLGGSQGVNYFHPNRSLFKTNRPFPDEKASRYSRGITEDHLGNLWITTADGITRYNPSTKAYRIWANEPNKPPVIYSNSSRGIVEDAHYDIWIATSSGLNCYTPSTNKMRFLTLKDGFPQAFYLCAIKDKRGRLWFGAVFDDGLYCYDPLSKKTFGISTHPILKQVAGKGVRYVYEDSKGRLWLGFDRHGLAMYDESQQTIRTWFNQDTGSDSTIIGNAVVDIKEDKNGVIWVATFSGITGIDLNKNSYKSFNRDNGLPVNNTSALAVDSRNRLWIGTTNGLAMLDSSRKTFTHFREEDGLPTLNFPEHPSYGAQNGTILMPTMKGVIQFNPLDYQETKEPVVFYADSYNVFNEEHTLTEGVKDADMSLNFAHDENYLTFNLVGLNFINPSTVWYAYRLDGLETEWHYTQDPKAIYTNVRGGNYTFLYKASNNATDWWMNEKRIKVHVATLFYKSLWFWLFLSLVVGGLAFSFYEGRKSQKDREAALLRKAELLEKEKAIMQYEGLKQQLNPHFLFNSLTSLSSLIETDTDSANAFLENLSKTYRYILKSSESETVLLSHEVKFVQNFIQLQKMRFEEGLVVNFDLTDEALRHKIAPVTLQNLIENAMKHNIIDPKNPLIIDIFSENRLNPKARTTERGQFIVVHNNLQKKRFVATSNKQGLVNLVNLYQYLSDKPIQIIETDTSFTVKIPLI